MQDLIKSLLKIECANCLTGRECIESYKRDIEKTCCTNYIHFIFINQDTPGLDSAMLRESIETIYAKTIQKSKYSHIATPKIFLLAKDIKFEDQSSLLSSKISNDATLL